MNEQFRSIWNKNEQSGLQRVKTRKRESVRKCQWDTKNKQTNK